jgi:Tol biopolymer transport system component
MQYIRKTRGIEQQMILSINPNYTVIQLTNTTSFESQHTYYDICPWSHDECYIVFSSAPIDEKWTPFGHDTLACREGRVNIIDTETLEIQEVADHAIYMKHGGAFCIWHPKQHSIFYRKDAEHSARIDLDTGKISLLPGRIRQISPDSTHFLTIQRSPHHGSQGAEIGMLSEDGSESRTLVNREQLYDLTPNRDQFLPEDMLLGNTKWHPSGEHILLTAWIYPHPEVHRSLYIVSRDGSEVRWLTYFKHHHSWTPDGRYILFNDQIPSGEDEKTEPRMFLINFDGTNRRVIVDHPIGSHPLMHPDGEKIVDADKMGIYIAHLQSGNIERLVNFAQTFDGTHHGTHPHPVWNHDGLRILYNSAERGHSELYLIQA